MSPGVPYVSVRSNDVLNGTLDLVLRLCTRADTVWRTLRPFKEGGNFPSAPLTMPMLRNAFQPFVQRFCAVTAVTVRISLHDLT